MFGAGSCGLCSAGCRDTGEEVLCLVSEPVQLQGVGWEPCSASSSIPDANVHSAASWQS